MRRCPSGTSKVAARRSCPISWTLRVCGSASCGLGWPAMLAEANNPPTTTAAAGEFAHDCLCGSCEVMPKSWAPDKSAHSSTLRVGFPLVFSVCRIGACCLVFQPLFVGGLPQSRRGPTLLQPEAKYAREGAEVGR